MMGIKERNFQPLPEDISLEDLVPEDNFYRRLQERLDLSFVRELVEDLYAPSGRPSIDPEVFFRLQMVMFHEGVRSERELMRVVCDRLSVRWYVGYDLFEALPDHSSLTRIRDRYGLSVFREFFERVVELYIEAGLVWGEELYFDATKVDADASLESIAPRFYVEEHLGELFAEEAPSAHNKGRALSWLTTVVSRMWPSCMNCHPPTTKRSWRAIARRTTGFPEMDARDAR
jgi:transposase